MAQGRRIVWLNVITVISAAILIGAEVFGAAFAGSWALATLFDLGGIGQRILDGVFVLCGIAIMAQFIRNAHRIEPFTAPQLSAHDSPRNNSLRKFLHAGNYFSCIARKICYFNIAQIRTCLWPCVGR